MEGLTGSLLKDFSAIINEIRSARNRALESVNKGLVLLYWQIGQRISVKMQSAAWGEGTIDKLAAYIKEKAPDLKGFTRRNLYRMRQFYETYQGNEIVSTVLTQLPWSAHLHILSKTTSLEEKQFYLLLAAREKYSVRELERPIDSGYFERFMLAQKNLDNFVSPALEKLHPDISKSFLDTYVLDFLNLPGVHTEQDFQQSIVSNLKIFI